MTNAEMKQWDRGLKLEISGLGVTEDTQVHFSLEDNKGKALCYQANVLEDKLLVDVPQFILENENARGTMYSAYAWIYVSTEEYGKTIRKIIFNVSIRPKPEDYISNPDDVKTWENHEKRIKELEENGVSDETIAQAVEDYLDENPIETVTSWNDLKDKPFYDTRHTEEIDNSFNYTFDGNLEGREYIVDGSSYIIKLSDTPLTKEELLGSSYTFFDRGRILDLVVEESNLTDYESYINLSPGNMYSVFEDSSINNVAFSVGLWIVNVHSMIYISSFSKTVIETVERGELKQLDEKYIPDSVKNPIFLVEFNRESGSTLNTTTETTHAEIYEAYKSGKIIKANWDMMEFELAIIDEHFAVFEKTNIGTTIGSFVITLDDFGYVEVVVTTNNIGDSNRLTTTSKQIVGAINELNEKFNSLVDGDEVSY